MLLVINGITRLLRNSIPGVAAAFGDMMARGQKELIQKNFDLFELLVFSLSTILFTITGIMLVPFVMLYTKGIHDVEYSRQAFAIIISIAAFFGCIRIPYQHVVEAAGHYKQTKKGAFIEAGLNILISIVAVFKFGLVGVAFGTLVATVFRTIQYATYLSKYIIPRSYKKFIIHIVVSAIVTLTSIALFAIIPKYDNIEYINWALNACIAGSITVLLVVGTDLLIYHNDTIRLMRKISGILKRNKDQ